MVTHHPADIAEGYCGNCHTWTSPPLGGSSSRGLWQLQPPTPFTRPEPPAPSDQLAAAMRYLRSVYGVGSPSDQLAAAMRAALQNFGAEVSAQMLAVVEGIARAVEGDAARHQPGDPPW